MSNRGYKGSFIDKHMQRGLMLSMAESSSLKNVSGIELLVEGLPTLRVRTALEHAQAHRRKAPASPGSCSEIGGIR
jgi:hypothetical protein